jgi:hypothetical protein
MGVDEGSRYEIMGVEDQGYSGIYDKRNGHLTQEKKNRVTNRY